MLSIHCHTYDGRLPDAGDGICCIGAAMNGPGGCTCWVERYDKRQRKELRTEIQPAERTDPCEDCAYRSGSPEKRGEPGYNGSAGDLEELAWGAVPFYCHQGIRRVVKMVHPSGAEIPGSPASYTPPQRDGVPYKASGKPADICAGWAARHRAVLKECAES